jgi:hypothetical protein
MDWPGIKLGPLKWKAGYLLQPWTPPPYNNLFYMSSLGWVIEQIVSMLRSFFLSSVCTHIRLDVVYVGKFPLLSAWKELLFNCRQNHTICNSQICFADQVLPQCSLTLDKQLYYLRSSLTVNTTKNSVFGTSVCYWRVCSLLKSERKINT